MQVYDLIITTTRGGPGAHTEVPMKRILDEITPGSRLGYACSMGLVFGAILLGGLPFRQLFLKFVMGEAIRMDDDGWRKLTLRWGLFFFFLAILNEIVWRTQATIMWVNFKVFGLLPLTLLFALAQTPLMTRHMIEDQARES